MTNTPPKVVVLGSLHYDIVVDAPDRPRKGETLSGRSWRPKCGGKGGNQAVAAARAGVPTAMVGAVGDDEFGRALLDNLARAGIDQAAVKRLAGVGSGMSVAILDDDGDYGAVIVSGANLLLTADQCNEALLHDANVLVLQNEVPEAINAGAALAARRHGVSTILNAAPARPFTSKLPDLVDILVVNAVEAEMLGAGPVQGLPDARLAARTLLAQFKAVLVTAGGEGVAYADRVGGEHALPAVSVRVHSTHGAGDKFVGTLAAALAGKQPMSVALDLANKAAAALVATPEADRT